MSFKKDFPSLKDLTTDCRGMEAINIKFIQKHCIDKQKVKEKLDWALGLYPTLAYGSIKIIKKELGLE